MMTSDNTDNWKLAGLLTLSWLGMAVHNRFELPQLPLYRWEYIFPALVSLALFLGWWRLVQRRHLWTWLILAWSALHFIIGGILSVLPLPLWPFSPEQSAGHYLSHLVYSLAQVPLLKFSWTRLPFSQRQNRQHAG